MQATSPAHPSGPEGQQRYPIVYSALLGAFFALTMLKFGNPPIMEKWVTAPTSFWEFVLGYPWPIAWAYRLLAVLVVVGLPLIRARWEMLPRVAWLPAAWFVWEVIAGTQSLDSNLTWATLKHFLACVACFYLGLMALAKINNPWPFFAALLVAFAIVIFVGWQQKFGGLEDTRRYFFTYIYPTLKEVPPDYLKKIQSNRIYATLFYPNTLAGALVLLLPAVMMTIWQARAIFARDARIFLVSAFTLGALACLFWSGSKGGFLIMLLVGLIPMMRLPLGKQIKIATIGFCLVIGLVGFFWKYQSFFRKGATSVSARFDYWHAAISTTMEKPLFGTGAGTFAIPYAKIKRPESEMARLVHNDYLEQASDSGIPGFLLYTSFIVGAIVISFRKIGRLPDLWDDRAAAGTPTAGPKSIQSKTPLDKAGAGRNSPPLQQSLLAFAVWLGVLGWCVQGLFEFGLYVPALAWTGFALLGWLLGRNCGQPSTAQPGAATSKP